jgi:uncharacterized protein
LQVVSRLLVTLTATGVLKRYKDEDLPEFCELVLVDINQPGNFGNLPIHVAAVRGSIEELEALIAAGANVNAAGELGNRPLHDAVGQGHDAAVEVLVNAGARIDALNDDGKSPRDIAQALGRSGIMGLLDPRVP